MPITSILPTTQTITEQQPMQEEQPYKYNGKELDQAHGLNQYDYSARHKDDWRFITVDPHAENYFSMSPYVYCGNNPINRIDPIGMDSVGVNSRGEEVWRIVADGDDVIFGSTDNIMVEPKYTENFDSESGISVNSYIVSPYEMDLIYTHNIPRIGGNLETLGFNDPIFTALTLGRSTYLGAIQSLAIELTKPKVNENVVCNGPRGKGERGWIAKPEGTENPFKKMTPDPKNPNKVNYKDADGKTKSKPKPDGFDEYWNKKHPPKQ